eukprot:TRINITY_DN1817_c0_g3_i1.p1 TRINITY_DN1817_c0_g3~~TRINITY_DN1817_c0_g3_i1.p1  ORF type:complete len:338 (-),score=77.17 TRINITY_DN1817_c0_g3_i1:280-1272(-)
MSTGSAEMVSNQPFGMAESSALTEAGILHCSNTGSTIAPDSDSQAPAAEISTEAMAEASEDKAWQPQTGVFKMQMASEMSEASTQSSGGAVRGPACQGNMGVLALTASLFSLITVVQVFAALAASSRVLLMDSVSMGVDASTYFANIFVETQSGKRYHRHAEIVVSAVSIAILIYFTIVLLVESLESLWAKEAEDVNPYIVLSFAIWGILFDVASIAYFVRNSKQTEGGTDMNMWTAFMHVSADLLRSCTTLVASLLMLGGFDGGAMDAWASIFVAVTILVGGAGGVVACCRSSVRLLRNHVKTAEVPKELAKLPELQEKSFNCDGAACG